jgi:perosamine synthetase
MEKKINQMEPWLDEKERQAVDSYLQSGGWLTEFKKTAEFEQAIADYTGAKYCSVVVNGTVSLAAAIMALGISGDDEVIVPDYTMIASANAVVLAGAKPVLVDINPNHLGLDLEAARNAITKKTRAIMLVAINGRCPQVEAFAALAKEKNLFLIEDAAQALGSSFASKHLGTFGAVGSFSFSAPKIITTGQGGALVTDDHDLYQKILKIKDFGRERSGVDRHVSMGFNFKFTDLQAVIGLEQMKKLSWRAQRKKEMFSKYQELLVGVSQVRFVPTNLQDTSPWFIDILVPAQKRQALVDFLAADGIGSRTFYPALHTQEPYRDAAGSFPGALEISESGLWLPSSSFLTDEDIDRVCGRIQTFFNA